MTISRRLRFEILRRDSHTCRYCGAQAPDVNITVDHETATRRKVDTVACAPAYKAAQDGLVDAGVLADDTPEHVASVTFLPPRYSGRDALTLTLEEVS